MYTIYLLFISRIEFYHLDKYTNKTRPLSYNFEEKMGDVYDLENVFKNPSFELPNYKTYKFLPIYWTIAFL